MKTDIDNDFKERQQKHIDYFTSCLSTLSSTVVSNKEPLQKVKPKLDTMAHTVSKLDYQLNKEQDIYVD
eukprot:1364305-Ditylum_brightwellii.AAC.2